MDFAPAGETPGGRLFCSECGRSFPAEDVMRFGAAAVCAECKPRFVQRMQEGAYAPAGFIYGGFWRRFVAFMLDAIILTVINFPIQLIFGIYAAAGSDRGNPRISGGAIALVYVLSLATQLVYYTWFISQKGATPGKRVMGLKVITPDGGPISVGRAAGRFFAQILSGLILSIGFIIAAFDREKRALHDYICGTRVVRT